MVEKNSVSIPFKRESGSKGQPTLLTVKWHSTCFNSLQTGKRIQSGIARRKSSASISGFNSLQTGKRIQRICEALHFSESTLGFNSLQTGKRIQRHPQATSKEITMLISFNSLQTGKRIQSDCGSIPPLSHRHKVSIPFKRESGSKAGSQRGWDHVP